MVVGLNLNNPPALESKRLTCLCRTLDSRPFTFEAIVIVCLIHPFRCCDCLVKFRELLHRHWVLTTSLTWVWFLVFIQRKRRRSLTVGNGSGVSVCPPMVTVAWGHVRALALELSANKPPRLRSVRFPATGKSNLEVRSTYISSSLELEHIRHRRQLLQREAAPLQKVHIAFLL